MDDLISRQAAIDALDFEIVHMTAYCDGKNEGNPFAQYNKGLEDGKKAIEALPPAQPEPTDINAKEAVYNLAEKIGIHQLFALTVELRGEPIQPEPHEGHWINGKCDRCGEHAPFWCMASTYHESNYCPNCGAKMTISK